MAFWNTLRICGIFCVHLVHFSGFGILDQDKSGNPGEDLAQARNVQLLTCSARLEIYGAVYFATHDISFYWPDGRGSIPGLPDGLFSNPKSQLWLNLEGLGMENVVIFFDHLEYFAAIWYNIWPFGIVCGHLVYFYVLVCLEQEKSGNPGAFPRSRRLH
jgi:hypothetical protein